MPDRRSLIAALALAPLAAGLVPRRAQAQGPALSPMAEGSFPVTRSEAEWRAMLNEEEFMILRRGATAAEWAFEGYKDFREGLYTCRGCGQHLFQGSWKFDAGIGWPNFHTMKETSLGWRWDTSMEGFPRRALHCTNCGSHHGHLFHDGPTEAKTRYCMNDPAMVFTPATT